jgi:hypothetical protein
VLKGSGSKSFFSLIVMTIFKIVGRDMSFATATSTVDRVLSSDLRMRDVESCGGGS